MRPETTPADPVAWSPVPGEIFSRWATEVDPAAPLPEHPRPQMRRPDWINLNGLWEYSLQPRHADKPHFSAAQRILVPFPIESALSGVGRAIGPEDRLWYRRTAHVPDSWRDSRLLLHFGAVDFAAEVWVGGVRVGAHEGGFTPFTFDITEQCADGSADIVVAVLDATDRERGKQDVSPDGLFYTAASGIWQTVWIEAVPQQYIRDLKIVPAAAAGTLEISATVGGGSHLRLHIEVREHDKVVATASGTTATSLLVAVPGARLWSPDDPFLYDLTARLLDREVVVDEVASYAGIRTISIERDADGYRRFHLNGEPLFLSGVLDQGYWPDGIYTAPTDKALAFDVEVTRRLGFNLSRKHAKVEPARWYHHCDRLGLLVWQDMPSGGPSGGPRVWTALLMAVYRTLTLLHSRLWNGRFTPWLFRELLWQGRWAKDRRSEASRASFESQHREMIDALRNSPSIVGWVPFNEGWGQFEATRVAQTVARQDPTRIVDHASGWFDELTGDIVSYHDYARRPGLPARRRIRDRVIALSEYGGLTLVVNGHHWGPGDGHAYHLSTTGEELDAVYAGLLEHLQGLKDHGLAAAVLTQLTDVENELNGLVTYDRAVVKIDETTSRSLHRNLTSRRTS